MVGDGEAGPLERPEVLVVERTTLHLGEGSSVVVPVWSNPYTCGGSRLTWQDCVAPGDRPVFALDDQ